MVTVTNPFFRWIDNQKILNNSCGQYNQANNSPQEIEQIDLAIHEKARTHNVDPRFILATVVQESGGCVRAPTTKNATPNPGLMQSFGGASCHGQVPCPSETIRQMVEDGTGGTAVGEWDNGLGPNINRAGSRDALGMYRAAQMYNSGYHAYYPGKNLGLGWVGTPCYASDIANRLMGWAEVRTPCRL